MKKMNCETWVGSGLGTVLLDAMRKDEDDVVRANACNHWLPATVTRGQWPFRVQTMQLRI